MNTVTFPKLGLEFNLNRFISVFGFDIAWYAIIISCGFLLAVIYAMKRMKQFGLESDRTVNVILLGMIGGIVGARLYYVIFSWDLYKDDLLSIFNTRQGGMAIYGGLIGAVLLGALGCKIWKVKLLPMLDLASIGFLIGQGIGRWGNFVNVEAYGSPTNSLLGMNSPSIENGPVHPCFLYESLWCLLGFVLLHFYSKRRKFDGEVLLMYMGWYGLGRMFIEGMRQDSLYWGPFRVSQVLSAILLIVSIIVWFVIRSRIKRNNDPEYLKLYVDTEESKEILRQAEEKEKKTSETDEVLEESLEDGVAQLNSESLQRMNREAEQQEQETEEENKDGKAD